ncbi:MAG: MerR family DNA-binding transcriptional regulator [Devosiaceae bacterium]|nr:MerR family DNA-binding transcriptional regulator [Devosiaceae bacterium]
MNRIESDKQELYAIAGLAKEFDISTRTIRFYESKGLLFPRRVGGTRVFNKRDRARLILILRGKRLGFSLKEIEEYLSLYDADQTHDAQVEKLLEMVNLRLGLLKEQMQDLKTTTSELSEIKKLVRQRLARG